MIPAGTPDIVESDSKVAAERVLIVEDDAAARVDKAVEQYLATRGDEKLSTTQVGDRIAASL